MTKKRERVVLCLGDGAMRPPSSKKRDPVLAFVDGGFLACCMFHTTPHQPFGLGTLKNRIFCIHGQIEQ